MNYANYERRDTIVLRVAFEKISNLTHTHTHTHCSLIVSSIILRKITVHTERRGGEEGEKGREE